MKLRTVEWTGRLKTRTLAACVALACSPVASAAIASLASQPARGPRYSRISGEGLIFLGALFFAAGAVSIFGGVAAPDWFMNNHRAKPLVAALGRTGAQAFYVLIGVFAIFIAALVVLLGINKL